MIQPLNRNYAILNESQHGGGLLKLKSTTRSCYHPRSVANEQLSSRFDAKSIKWISFTLRCHSTACLKPFGILINKLAVN